MKKCKKIYQVDGMIVSEKTFTDMCKAAGVDGYPRRKLRPKYKSPTEPDEWEIDEGPWQAVERDDSSSRFCHADGHVLVETWVK